MTLYNSTDARSYPSLVHDILEDFQIGPDDVRKITRGCLRQMKDGLSSSRPWQLPSYVYRVPDGTEKGTFLTVDLGGTNCRVCLVELLGDSTYKTTQTKQAVPKHVRINPRYGPLFSFIAKSISDFMDQHGLRPKVCYGPAAQIIPLGFTFSFTCEQTSLVQGTLIQWDKGWDISEALGKDPCAMLQESIDELGLPVRVSALANDSVGTLLSRAYVSQESGSTVAGIIIGTGTNAAYIEKLSNVRRLPSASTAQGHESIVINTEWGCFDDELQVLPTTQYDRTLDVSSANPGNQQLEKRVSGMYLGELMRLVILHCQSQRIFNMVLNDSSPCNRSYGLDSSFLSLLARDEIADSRQVATAIESVLNAHNVTPNDVRMMKLIAAAIAKRSARLAGSALGAIIIQSGRLSGSQSEKRTVRTGSFPIHHHNARSAKEEGGCFDFFTRVRKYIWSFGTSIPGTQTTQTQSCVAGEDVIDVGVDGSLIELYPGFEAHIRSALIDIYDIGLEGESRIKLGLAKDGSGVGAALIANSARYVIER